MRTFPGSDGCSAPCHARSALPYPPPTLCRVRIPDGDLVPARKHRYGGGYGRRRRSHRSRLLVAVVAVLLVGTAGAWFLNRQSPSTPQTLSSCPTPRPT